MYEVVKDGEVVCKINETCYVWYLSHLDSWNVCRREASQAIWVVPYVEEETEEQPDPWYARLEPHPITEKNKDFPLVELKEVN